MLRKRRGSMSGGRKRRERRRKIRRWSKVRRSKRKIIKRQKAEYEGDVYLAAHDDTLSIRELWVVYGDVPGQAEISEVYSCLS